MRALPVLLLLAACASDQANPLDALRRESVRNAPITREQADAQPFASILARQDGGRPALLILQSAGASGGGAPARLTWLSADRQAIMTQGGRLIATGGGRRNLAGTVFQDADPLRDPLQIPVGGVFARRAVDILPGTDRDAEPAFGLQLDCRLAPEVDETIVVLDRPIEARRIAESCTGSGASHRNTFWADLGTGFIWRSDQWAGPGAPRLTIEVLKPAED
jgi:hypothetical protein